MGGSLPRGRRRTRSELSLQASRPPTPGGLPRSSLWGTAIGPPPNFINPILRGWVNYFAVGHSSRCFGFVRDWVEKKIRRHLMRARGRQGFGWAVGP